MTNTIVAVEITTYCNFDCDYCYNKQYEHKMMDFDTFKSIIDEWRDHPTVVDFSLSGEGESMLHPQVWQFVDYVRTTKHEVSMITNGSVLTQTNIANAASKLSRIRVSLDTMDSDVAEHVGRHYHDKVVIGIKQLVDTGMPVHIMTTNFGQDIEPIRKFIRSLKAPNVSQGTQPLQSKNDYATSYTVVKPIFVVKDATQWTTVMCGNILANRLISYTVDGIKLPCCYIKDRSQYIGYDQLVKQLSTPTNTQIPTTCIGCKELVYHK